ncbi:hypothetical protein MTO96_026288 [Rhipicephalus appendiculatus]
MKRYEDIIFGAITRYSNPFTGALVSRQISKLEMILQNFTYLDSVQPEKLVKGVTTMHMLPKSDRWDWLKYMALLFHAEPHDMRSTPTIVDDPVFFSQFSSIFDMENYRTAIANYVGFKAMVTLAPLMSPGYAELYELGYGYDIPKLEPQLLACTLLLEKIYRYGVGIAAKLTLSQEFANIYRRHRDAQLQDLFNETRAVLRPMLLFNQSWFSTSDIEQVLRKLDRLSIVFGTQDNFLQYEKYRKTPPLPRGPNETLLGTAFTMFSHASSIYWNAWNSQDVTDKAYDNAYHMSAFEWGYEYQPGSTPNQLRLLSTVPDLRGSWWSAASVEDSENATKCIQRQYRAAAAAEFGWDQPSPERWSIARIEEAFLDNAVLVPLYELYERALNSHNATDMFYQLPDWRVTMRELFFYNYVVSFCDDGDNDARRTQYLLGMTPNKWRVNVPLRNFPPFRKAFSCSVLKQPQEYCHTWSNLG